MFVHHLNKHVFQIGGLDFHFLDVKPGSAQRAQHRIDFIVIGKTKTIGSPSQYRRSRRQRRWQCALKLDAQKRPRMAFQKVSRLVECDHAPAF